MALYRPKLSVRLFRKRASQPKQHKMSNVVVEYRNQPPLTAKSLKATLVLTPADLFNIPVPEGKPRCLARTHRRGWAHRKRGPQREISATSHREYPAGRSG
jgi:hypothetical protein